ncbi:hypothetical protein [Salirhabdus salicampi]|uniref:hypothetical protein n=1 Tax=Salirhabdus salicampi TaxID=476102 RepID=UPI0020C4076B|nr:hypothetical protein [Salirhabdus salicampi]MCP8616050.1 hypothetical protein [Salirhabdus salicampi]
MDGKRVQTHEELSNLRQEGYVIKLGFPIPFLKQGIPPLDPPMPYTFGFSFWHVKSFEKLNYFYSVGIVFGILVIIKALIKRLK